jgi:hypothetical protein
MTKQHYAVFSVLLVLSIAACLVLPLRWIGVLLLLVPWVWFEACLFLGSLDDDISAY